MARRRPRWPSCPRSSAASSRSCASTRSIRVTCGRRCSRTRSPARTSPTGRRRRGRPRPARPDRGRPAERRLPRPGAGRGVGVSALAFDLPDGLEAREPPEAPAAAVMTSACSSPRRALDDRAHALRRDPRFLAAGDLVVVNTSATLPAALPDYAADGTELELQLSTPAPGRDDDVWIVELRRGDAPFAGASVGERFTLPAGATAGLVDRYAGVRLLFARLDSRAAPRLPRRARPADPLRVCPGELAARRLPDRLRGQSGQRGDAERGRPFTAELITRLVARCPRRAGHAPHRRLLAGAARAAVSGALSRPRADCAAPQRHPSLRRPGDRDRNDGRPRAGDGRGAGRHRRRGRGLDEPRRHAGTRALDGRRPADRPARVGVVTPRAARPPPATTWSRAATARRRAGYRWHEFGDSHLIL